MIKSPGRAENPRGFLKTILSDPEQKGELR